MLLPPKHRSHRRPSIQLFREARTHSTWLPEPVPEELLRKAYELARLGPTRCRRLACQVRFSDHPRRRGASQASSGARQCRQNHGCSCNGDLLCNLGYGDPSKLHPRNPSSCDFIEVETCQQAILQGRWLACWMLVTLKRSCLFKFFVLHICHACNTLVS
jgi:hypothetical protein